MRDVLALLSKAYDYPVDIEFTANFSAGGQFKVNLLQCRPLQTRGLGKPIEIPKLYDKADCFFSVKGNFMGGNIRLPLDYVVYVDAQAYRRLNEQNKYAVARQIGVIKTCLRDKNTLLIGPGRMGHHLAVAGRTGPFYRAVQYVGALRAFLPGSGVYARIILRQPFFPGSCGNRDFLRAILVGHKDVSFEPGRVLGKENQLAVLSPQSKAFRTSSTSPKRRAWRIFPMSSRKCHLQIIPGLFHLPWRQKLLLRNTVGIQLRSSGGKTPLFTDFASSME